MHNSFRLFSHCFRFLFSTFFWVTWTCFRISFWFIYNIVQVALFCTTFLGAALDVIIFSQRISLLIVAFYQFVVKCRNLTLLYVPLPSPTSHKIILNISSTCLGSLIGYHAQKEWTSTGCPVFALPIVSSSFLGLPRPLRHFLSRELPLLFQGRPAGDIACEGCFPLIQNSELTVFLQHSKNVPLPSNLRGFWQEIHCHSNCFSTVGKVTFPSHFLPLVFKSLTVMYVSTDFFQVTLCGFH